MAGSLGYDSEEGMLRGLYVDRGLSVSRIGNILGYTPQAISWRLAKYGIKPRPRGGYHRFRMEDLCAEAPR